MRRLNFAIHNYTFELAVALFTLQAPDFSFYYFPYFPRIFTLARDRLGGTSRKKYRGAIASILETIYRRLNPRRISSDGRLLLSLLPLALCVSRRLFVSAHRVLTLLSSDGRRRDNISTASGDICSGGVSGCWAAQKKDLSHKV